MANNEKRRQLDDEMSRFEAEISGPTGLPPLQPPPGPPRTVLGTRTFNQVTQRLKTPHEDSPPPLGPGGPRPGHPQGLPGPPRPQRPYLGPQRPPGPPGPGPPGGHGPGGPRGPHAGPPGGPPGGPRGPHGGPPGGPPGGMGPRHHGPPGGGYGPPGGPQGGPHGGPPHMRPMAPPPPPPGYIGPQMPGGPRGFGPMQQNHMGPHPPPPPGFIPPQVNRGPMNNWGDGPMMGNSGPPPPPPGYMRPAGPMFGPRPPTTVTAGPIGPMARPNTPNSGPSISAAPVIAAPLLFKPSSVISAAPKVYSSQPTKYEGKPTVIKGPTTNQSIAEPEAANVMEPKKKKMKGDIIQEVTSITDSNKTHAQEMAERVRASMNIVKTVVSKNASDDQPVAPVKKKERKPKKILRCAGGQVWEDHSLMEWDSEDFRMFAGDLGNDVTDELLHRYFSHYPSFNKAKVVRDKRTSKSKGYGFISFSDPQDYIRAMKEMNGKYLGSRPIKLRKSMWKDRNVDTVQKKQKEKQLLGLK